MTPHQETTAPDIATWNVHADEIMKGANPDFVCRGSVDDLFLERGNEKDFIGGLVRFMLTRSQQFAGGMIFSRAAYEGSSSEYWIDVWPTEPTFTRDGEKEIWRKCFGGSDPRVKDCYDASDFVGHHIIGLFQSDEIEKEKNEEGYKAKVLPEPDYRHSQG